MKFFYNASAEQRASGTLMSPTVRAMFKLRSNTTKTLVLGVKLAAVFILTACLQVSAKTTNAQKLSLSFKNGSLEKLFAEIEKKTTYVFFYDVGILKGTKPVTVEVRDASVEDILQSSLKGQALEFSIHDKTIFVKKETEKTILNATEGNGGTEPKEDISIFVSAQGGSPLAGASVSIKKLKRSLITNASGESIVRGVPYGKYEVEISYIGYEKVITTIIVGGKGQQVKAEMKTATNGLDEAVVIPYGQTTQRLATGDITKVTSKEIERQPVTNVLAALEGRVPGLVITEQTGMPGGGFTVQIRGQNSISGGNDPFYVIDGVPYNSQIPFTLNGLGIINNSLKNGSPLNFINPADIESVEVLKDADATAIY